MYNNIIKKFELRDLFIIILLIFISTMQLRIYYIETTLKLQWKLNNLQGICNTQQAKLNDAQSRLSDEIVKRITQ